MSFSMKNPRFCRGASFIWLLRDFSVFSQYSEAGKYGVTCYHQVFGPWVAQRDGKIKRWRMLDYFGGNVYNKYARACRREQMAPAGPRRYQTAAEAGKNAKKKGKRGNNEQGPDGSGCHKSARGKSA